MNLLVLLTTPMIKKKNFQLDSQDRMPSEWEVSWCLAGQGHVGYPLTRLPHTINKLQTTSSSVNLILRSYWLRKSTSDGSSIKVTTNQGDFRLVSVKSAGVRFSALQYDFILTLFAELMTEWVGAWSLVYTTTTLAIKVTQGGIV